MKKIYILFVLLLSSVIHSQTKGMTYQAVILKPEGENIPGYNNERAPLTNTSICLRFSIYKGTVLEYQETKNTITDEFGMVNVIIGTGVFVDGSSNTLSGVNWDGTNRNLVVEVDIRGACSSFIEISNQPFTYVAYAFYADNSGTTGSNVGDILYWNGTNWIILPIGTNGQNLTVCNGVPIWGPCVLPSSNGTAVISSFNSCNTASTGSLTAGVFVNGVAQTINITVGTIGTYNISAITNGVTFSATGTFTTTGAQNIVLSATGTPTTVGTNTFTLNTTPTCSFTRNSSANATSNGTAVITSIISCSTASAGTLTAGVAVSGVTQTINVTVGTIGTYNISAIANGVTFSATGTFTTTGAQNIVLSATGTPTTVGTNTFTLNILPNCSFSLTTIPLIVTDIDGNNYSTIQICNQIWTQSNFNVSRYRNGDLIPQITNASEWANTTTGAWCYYQNNTLNGPVFGKLYNWYAVNDPRGLAPLGWHIPTNAEWTTLTDCLGGILIDNVTVGIAGGKMKQIGTSNWLFPNSQATNISGFNGLPGGLINYFGNFETAMGTYGGWWSSSQFGNFAAHRGLNYNNGNVIFSGLGLLTGLSVRLVKD